MRAKSWVYAPALLHAMQPEGHSSYGFRSETEATQPLSLVARKIIKLLHLSFGHNHNLPPNQINPSHSISSQYINILKSISSPSPLKLFILYSYFNAKERTRHFKCIKQQKKDKSKILTRVSILRILLSPLLSLVQNQHHCKILQHTGNICIYKLLVIIEAFPALIQNLTTFRNGMKY